MAFNNIFKCRYLFKSLKLIDMKDIKFYKKILKEMEYIKKITKGKNFEGNKMSEFTLFLIALDRVKK